MNKKELTIFCGGRGAKTIIPSIIKSGHYKINVLLNAFDDGKSTGVIRRVFSMLGPSDIRKVQILLADKSFVEVRNLIQVLEFRVTHENELFEIVKSPGSFFQRFSISPKNMEIFSSYVVAARKDIIESRELEEFSDFCIGNILYAGCYLRHGNNLNKAIREIESLLKCQGTVNTISDESLFLAGIDNSGKLFTSEFELDSAYNTKFDRIFLCEKPLDIIQQGAFQNQKSEEVNKLIDGLEKTPIISNTCRNTLLKSEIILYCPGTRITSFFPGLLIDDLAKTIASGNNQLKFFIPNLSSEYLNYCNSPEEELREFEKIAGLDLNELIDFCVIDPQFQQSISDDKIKEKIKILLENCSDGITHQGDKIVEVIERIKTPHNKH